MAITSAPNLIHKTLGVEATVLDEAQGIVEAFVSGVGNKDSVSDIIQPGAFDKYLKIRKPKGVWSHDWDRPVSKTLEIYEIAAGDARLPMKMQLAGIGGLYVKTQFNLATREGRDAFENVKFFGEEAEWSIGYQVHDQEFDKKLKANLLKVIELYEYSPVLFGSNTLTSTVSIKAARNADGEIECKVEGLDEIQTRAVKAALEVVLKEKDATVENDAQEEQIMSMQKNEATGLYEIDLEDGEVKAFRTEEKAEAFLTDCKAYADAVEAQGKDDDVDPELKAFEGFSDEDIEAVKTWAAAQKSEEGSVDGEKAVVGSMEERRQKLHAALSDFVGGSSYAYIVATFESSVIFETYSSDAGGYSYYQADYSTDDEGEFKFGEPIEVELVEVVLAKMALQEAVKADMVQEVKDAIADLPELAEIAEIAAKTAAVLDAKAGRVLSTKNRSNLEQALKAIEDVLDADVTVEETEEKSDADVAIERIEAHVKGGLISEEDGELMLKAVKADVEVERHDDEADEVVVELEAEGESEEDLDALKDLSDEELEEVKAWAEAVEADTKDDSEEEAEEKSSEESDDDEKSSSSELLSAKDELDALAAMLGDVG